MNRPSLVAAFVLVATTVMVSPTAPPIAVHAQSATDFVPVTDEMLQDPAPDDWLMWRRTLDGWGYSPLDQVTRENVDKLTATARKLSWSGRELSRLARRRARPWHTAAFCICRRRAMTFRRSMP